MKRKARIQTGIDDRLVAIYARKSRITNKGDSIGVQFKQSADYAINQLSLPEDYEFARYEDKGLSGYYSDRPDFQRLLRDIEMGKIKAVACYKLDRISRKTSDLMRLLEYFERHDVTLLVCSNNINTRISTSKIIIQVLAIIAEFERDILTERIQDNLMELAKDGRWLGGKTPTGFSSQRVTTGSGKNKSAISFLVPVQEEKEIVLEIYGTFWETRSLLQTANIISEKYETKHGAKFTTSTIRLILRNPIYCVADEYSYNYFLEHDGNLFGEPSDFDGQHGLTAYNKTDQMKVEDEDSTFFNPKFSQLLTRKPISEWIVSVGRHEGFISSRKWVETQNMLDEIAEKYNRPHRKTNALLSGLMYCPICGKRLRVLPESNRWTNGKPRFKYACPGVRAKECTFKGVEGVTLDEFVIHSLSSLQEEHSDYYRQLLENRVASMIRTDQSEKEYQETKKAIERLNVDIAAQVRNLREADDALKRFIQDDIKELTDELAKREAALRRMEDTQSENQYLIHELNGMKKRLLSFEEFAKGAQPEALFTLVHSIVDRIYITTDGTKQKCQVYIKGCATEDYSDVLGAAGYIEEEPLLPVASYVPPMCDLDYYSITSKQLQLIDPFTDELIPNDKIPDMEPYVYDWIVSDPGETAEGADCYMDYNTYPTSTDQCDLMEFSSANIHFIGEDGKIHTVSYSAENCGYALSENTEELYVWVDNDYTKMIPKPNTRIASADQFEEDCLGVKAYDMSHDDFLEYIDSCEQMGFQNKYPNEDLDYSYTGTNANGYEIDVRYIDNMHYIEITLQKEEQ